MKNNSNHVPVYSTETGRIKQGKVDTAPVLPKSDGIVRLRREVKGRGGGTVITISGISLPESSLKELAGQLKKKCGTGGTLKNGIIEIQGEHRDALMAELQTRGFKVKPAGG